MRNINCQVHEAQKHKDKETNTARHIMIKLLKTNDIKKILKVA